MTFEGITISENDAICRVVCQKWRPELLGKTEEEKALIENYFCALVKACPVFREPVFNPAKGLPPVEQRELTAVLEQVRVVFDAIEKRLATRKWIASEECSLVDIYFWEVHQAVKLHSQEFAAQFQHFRAFDERFEQQEWFK